MSDEEGRKERRAGPFGVSVVELQSCRGWSVWMVEKARTAEAGL